MHTREIAIGVVRSAATLAIALSFLLLLMIASAQQTVVATIEREALKIDYTSALRMVRELGEARAELAKRQAVAKENRRALSRSKTATMAASQKLRDLEQQIAPSLNRLVASQACEDLVALRASPDSTIVEEWGAVDVCYRTGAIPDRLKAEAERVLLLRKQAEEARSELYSARSVVERIEAEGPELNIEIKDWRGRIEGPGLKLEMLGYLLAMPVVGKSGLIETPPALMHILLAFFSGLFGAMLISLILAVYPHNEFEFTKAHGYFKRIFLGGLVSICVFVVIGGGLAVLETGGGIFDGSGNAMSFAAIGVLAGMFSDRVALWLSQRAETFFAKVPPT